jgi:FtsZ-interacting cell division protein ZipA
MSTSAIIVIVVVVVVVALAAALFVGQWRHHRLRSRFGSEYDRTLRSTDNRKEAERELAQREQRHAKLELHPLSAESRRAYETDWSRVQERFVDAPTDAVAEADRLITALLAERGYPTDEFDQQAEDLSVDHADVVDGYRRAHGVLNDQSDQHTDDLRRALLDYRSVFTAVLGRELHDSRA